MKGDSKDALLNKENNSKFIDLIKTKQKESNFMPDYILRKSFSGIVSIDNYNQEFTDNLIDSNIENLDLEYGILNMIEYKQEFIQLLDSLDEDKIYKIIFRWQSVDSNHTNRVEFNTSPSFLITNYSDVDILLYKFMSQFNDFDMKYGFSGIINLDIFIKEWINENEFNLFQEISQKIIDMEKNFKKSLVKKSKGKKTINSFEDNDNICEKSFFESDIDKLTKKSLSLYVPGENYGCLINKDEIISKKYEVLFNLDLDKDKLYSFSKNNKKYLCRVTSVLSVFDSDFIKNNFENKQNKVYIYLEPKISFDKNKTIMTELEQWVDIISCEGENIIVTRNCKSKGYSIKFINNKIINLDLHYNSKKLVEGFKDIELDTKIGVIDIETYKNLKNEAIPYAIGFISEVSNEIFYLDSYSTPDEMILAAIDSMLILENHNFKFYAHNMSGFDGIIILKSLMSLGDKHNLKFKIYSDNDGNIISLDIELIFLQTITIIQIELI